MAARFRLKEFFWRAPLETDPSESELQDPVVTSSVFETGLRDAPAPESHAPKTLQSGNKAPAAARARVERALAALRDWPGVTGSLAADVDGCVLGSDLPESFEEGVATRLAGRIAQLREVLALERGQFRGCVITCNTYQLHVHESDWGAIGVLIAPDVAAPVLDVALRLAASRIASATSLEAT